MGIGQRDFSYGGDKKSRVEVQGHTVVMRYPDGSELSVTTEYLLAAMRPNPASTHTAKNAVPVARLIRGMGKSDMGTNGRDVIFESAAVIIEEVIFINALLEDVPGDTAAEKVAKLKEWYQDLYNNQPVPWPT